MAAAARAGRRAHRRPVAARPRGQRADAAVRRLLLAHRPAGRRDAPRPDRPRHARRSHGVLLTATAVAVVADRPWLAVVCCTLAVAIATPAYPAMVAAMPGIAGAQRRTATDLLVTVEVAAFVVGAALGGLLLHPADARPPPLDPRGDDVVAAVLVLPVTMPAPERRRGPGPPSLGVRRSASRAVRLARDRSDGCGEPGHLAGRARPPPDGVGLLVLRRRGVRAGHRGARVRRSRRSPAAPPGSDAGRLDAPRSPARRARGPARRPRPRPRLGAGAARARRRRGRGRRGRRHERAPGDRRRRRPGHRARHQRQRDRRRGPGRLDDRTDQRRGCSAAVRRWPPPRSVWRPPRGGREPPPPRSAATSRLPSGVSGQEADA